MARAEEYLAAATTELEASRPIAATSLAIHAAINAADAVTATASGVVPPGKTTRRFARSSVRLARTGRSSTRILRAYYR